MIDPLRQAFEEVPVNRLLGSRLVQRSDQAAVVAFSPRPDMLQEEGVVQGGLLAALADTASVYILYPDLPPERIMTSVEFKVNFLRPGLPDAGPITAHARLVRRGRRIAVTEVDVRQDGRDLLRGLFTYLIYERETSES